MNDRSIIVQNIPLSDGRTLEMSVCYEMGGMSFLSGESSVRGYYIHASPIRINHHTAADGTKYSSRSFGLFDGGVKHLLKAADRFSKKVLAEMAQKAPTDIMYETMQAHVLARTKTTVVPPPEVAPVPAVA